MKKAGRSVKLIMSIFLAAGLMVCSLSAVASASNSNILTTITVNTFKNADRIKTLNIGREVEEISPNAFVNMINLTTITVAETNRYFSSYSGCLYDKDQTTLLCFPQARTSAYIPSTVVAIGECALSGVSTQLRKDITEVIERQKEGGANQNDVVLPHFIHTDSGLMWDDGRGHIIPVDSPLMEAIGRLVESATNDRMRQNDMLKSCYKYIISNTEPIEALEYPSGNWTGDKAIDLVNNGTGDCYAYAAAFAYTARSLGYEARVITGTAEDEDGVRRATAWTQVKIGGTFYAFDPYMEDIGRNNYYMMSADNTDYRRASATYTVVF